MFVGATLSIFHTVTVYQEWAEKQGASRESQNSGKCCVDARGQRRMTSLFGADRKVTLDRTSLLSANNRTLRLTLTKAGQQKIKQRFPGLSRCFGIKVAASVWYISKSIKNHSLPKDGCWPSLCDHSVTIRIRQLVTKVTLGLESGKLWRFLGIPAKSLSNWFL